MTIQSEPIPQFDPAPAPEQAWKPRVYTTVPGFIRHNFDFAADETAMVQKKGRVWQKLPGASIMITSGSSRWVNQPRFGARRHRLRHREQRTGTVLERICRAGCRGHRRQYPGQRDNCRFESHCRQCKPKFAIVQDQSQITKFQSIKDDMPNLKKIIYWTARAEKPQGFPVT